MVFKKSTVVSVPLFKTLFLFLNHILFQDLLFMYILDLTCFVSTITMLPQHKQRFFILSYLIYSYGSFGIVYSP